DVGFPPFEIDVQAFCEQQCEQHDGGYFAYPGDCCQFIVCSRLPASRGRGRIISNVMRCMFPLVWNSASATCDLEKRNPLCTSECHFGIVTPTTFTFPPLEENECIKGDRIYTKNDNNCFFVNRVQSSICCGSEGRFDLEECGCIEHHRLPTCDCIFCLAFERGEIIDVINTLYLNITGVHIEEFPLSADRHKGCFSGIGSSIKIPHFNNMIYGPIFSIAFFFEIPERFEDSQGVVNIPKQGLVSNGCCGGNGTIEFWIEGQKGYLNLITEKAELRNYQFDPYEDPLVPGQLIDITMVYCDPVLKIQYLGEPHDPITMGGDIIPTNCPLTVGNLNDVAGTEFPGCVENVIACRDCWSDPQVFALQQYDKLVVLCEP
ncbi:unnamed protein product, partial [Owenia fusiformis]